MTLAGPVTWTAGVATVSVRFATPFALDRVSAALVAAPTVTATSGTFSVTAPLS